MYYTDKWKFNDNYIHIYRLVVTVCDKNPLNTNCKTLKEEDMNKRYKFQFYHTNFIVNKNANDRVPVITYISDFLFF